MAEPYGIKLFSAGNFNGTTPIALTRADLTVDGQRLYTGAVPAGGGGVIDSDFFGLFAPQSPKLVGVAFSSCNPQSVVRVIDRAGRPRQRRQPLCAALPCTAVAAGARAPGDHARNRLSGGLRCHAFGAIAGRAGDKLRRTA